MLRHPVLSGNLPGGNVFEIKPITNREENYSATSNACKLCAPLGASVVFKGIRGCIPLIHGSQGCSTYIRRYLISHYKEPVDIASSNFSEETTIFGGGKNLSDALNNIIETYNPEAIGISSACLSETIGEDVKGLINNYKAGNPKNKLPELIFSSTPSYRGTHMNGFYETVQAVIASLTVYKEPGKHINIFPGFISPEDIRHLKEILDEYGLEYVLFPDYSETLDNPNWEEYKLIPDGGTPVEDIRKCGSAAASIEFGNCYGYNADGIKTGKQGKEISAGEWLSKNYNVKLLKAELPVGIKGTDKFFNFLSTISGKEIPAKYKLERGRLIDSYVDGHKYLFGKKAVVYGEADLIVALVSFLSEIGIDIVLAVSGEEAVNLKERLIEAGAKTSITVLTGGDFENMNEIADKLDADLLIGNSKGYYIARRLEIPLVRSGFPIHDRIGAQRIKHLCYQGTQQLFDRIVNALIEYKQENSPVGYKYI
jgi:nitrogenase molybdenum-iron protein NifN